MKCLALLSVLSTQCLNEYGIPMDNELAALMSQIIRDSNENAPRQAYADRLAILGDRLRSDFIRLQIEIPQLPISDPRRVALEYDADLLLARQCKSWVKELLKSESQECEFSRGFVSHIRTHASDFVTHGAELLRCTPLESVWLDCVQGHVGELLQCEALFRVPKLTIEDECLSFSELLELCQSQSLASLRHLGIVKSKLGNKVLDCIAAWPSHSCVTSLDLQQNELDAHGVAALCMLCLPQCQSITLTGNRIGGGGLLQLLDSSHFSALREINVANNHIDATVNEQLRRIRVPLGLAGLNVWWNRLDDESMHAIAYNKGLHSLVTFDIGANRVTDRGLLELCKTAFFESICDLSLFGNRITSVGLKSLIGSLTPKLTKLDVGCNAVGDDGAHAIATDQSLLSLAILNFDGNRVEDDGFCAVMASRHLSHLVSLSFNSNNITARGIGKSMQSGNLQRLRCLSLGAMNLGSAGLEAVTSSVWLPRLTHLDLHDNNIDDSGILHLTRSTGCSQLQFLDLAGNKLTDRGAALLAKSPYLANLTELNLMDNMISPSACEELHRLPHLTRIIF